LKFVAIKLSFSMLRSLARTEQALSLSINFINLFRSWEINRNQHTTSEDL